MADQTKNLAYHLMILGEGEEQRTSEYFLKKQVRRCPATWNC